MRHDHARWLVRAPGRQGALSPEEVAHALKARRDELRRSLDWRRDAAGVPAHVREEIVDEAIGLVVMSRNPIRNEEHLQGAFWTSVGYLLVEHRSGRHDLHVGSCRRVDFEPVAAALADEDEPFDLLAARERIATAADLMAQLDPFEQRVIAVMATHGLGVKRAAKALDEPVKTVLAASRSAQRKLDQVATITAAGRMCDYRELAIHAHAHGTAEAEQEKAARAHLAACAGCRSSYATLLREMSGQEFKRAASAAFLPPPAMAVELHGRWIDRLTTLLHTGRAPSGTVTAERTAGVLGGGGMVKVATAGTVLVIAGAGVGAKVIHSLTTPAPVHRHVTRTLPTSATPASIQPAAIAVKPISAVTQTTPRSSVHRTAERHAHHQPPPPSQDLEYLKLGQTPSATQTEPQANTATTSPAPIRTGGGTALSYLGG
ncbi:MAG: hypothetical protein WBQ21_05575 [Solirubrobacteraceae bacterium]